MARDWQNRKSERGIGNSARMRNRRMSREVKEAREQAAEMKRELGAAAEVQASLLPSKMPNLPGYDIWAAYRSAKDVGGDYYDFFPLDSEHLALVVADVSGKGIPGAMVMASIRTLLRVLGPQCISATETLKQTNVHVARDIKRGMFVTAIFAVLNVHTRELEVCSAGHNPMVVYKAKANRCGLLNPAGMALGFDKGPRFDKTLKNSKITLEPGDKVIMYSDGVPEAMNAEKEQFGEEHFYKWCFHHSQDTARDFVRNLVDDLDEHKGEAEQHDDITVTALRVL